MKVEDSGMPEETYWNQLFDLEAIVDWLNIPGNATIVEIGCGYGSFTVPIAMNSGGSIYALDIEPSMIEVSKNNVYKSGLSNVNFILRDVLELGTGLQAESADMVLLFNILHCSENRILLAEASRILRPAGIAAIIHWRKDIPTPRGPANELRPDIDQILKSSEGLSLHFHGNSKVLEPYHWGIQLVKEIAA